MGFASRELVTRIKAGKEAIGKGRARYNGESTVPASGGLIAAEPRTHTNCKVRYALNSPAVKSSVFEWADSSGSRRPASQSPHSGPNGHRFMRPDAKTR